MGTELDFDSLSYGNVNLYDTVDPEASPSIRGLSYYLGVDCDTDKYKSSSNFAKSKTTDKYYSVAMFYYGLQLLRGDGVDQNVVRAIECVKKAKSAIKNLPDEPGAEWRYLIGLYVDKFLAQYDRPFASVTCHVCAAIAPALVMVRDKVVLTETEGESLVEGETNVPASWSSTRSSLSASSQFGEDTGSYPTGFVNTRGGYVRKVL